jgi:two-component system response regulator AtoC
MRDKIMIIDDEANLRKIFTALLTRQGYEVVAFDGYDSAIPVLNTEDVDVLITDLSMPEKSGMDVLSYAKQYAPDLPVIMITAFGTIEAAVNALKNGAFDFILKPVEHDELARVIEKAIQSRRRRKRDPAMGPMEASGVGPTPIPLFGMESSTQELRKSVLKIEGNQSHVMMVGPLGSGKRSIAYQIHRSSMSATGPFIQVNCDAIPETFQVGELLGVEKGALPMSLFTRPGKLELASGGTLLLDEVGALGIDAQNALFNALENECFSRVGGAKQFPVDFRIIATSTKDLSPAVKEGTFHVELYHKLTVESIILKPLSERREDIGTHLFPYFLERACRKKGIPLLPYDPAVVEWFKNQAWPGNLGELDRRVEQLVNHVEGNAIRIEDI